MSRNLFLILIKYQIEIEMQGEKDLEEQVSWSCRMKSIGVSETNESERIIRIQCLVIP